MNHPDYIDAAIVKQLESHRMCRRWGLLNIYTCEVCEHQLVTTDLAEGTTPFITRCPECMEAARSGMYRVAPTFSGYPTHGWYRPATLKGITPDTRDHLKRGGLIVRPLTADEIARARGE